MTCSMMDHREDLKSKTSAIMVNMLTIDELIASENHVRAKGERIRQSERVWTRKGGSVGIEGSFPFTLKASQRKRIIQLQEVFWLVMHLDG